MLIQGRTWPFDGYFDWWLQFYDILWQDKDINNYTGNYSEPNLDSSHKYEDIPIEFEGSCLYRL